MPIAVRPLISQCFEQLCDIFLVLFFSSQVFLRGLVKEEILSSVLVSESLQPLFICVSVLWGWYDRPVKEYKKLQPAFVYLILPKDKG